MRKLADIWSQIDSTGKVPSKTFENVPDALEYLAISGTKTVFVTGSLVWLSVFMETLDIPVE